MKIELNPTLEDRLKTLRDLAIAEAPENGRDEPAAVSPVFSVSVSQTLDRLRELWGIVLEVGQPFDRYYSPVHDQRMNQFTSRFTIGCPKIPRYSTK